GDHRREVRRRGEGRGEGGRAHRRPRRSLGGGHQRHDYLGPGRHGGRGAPGTRVRGGGHGQPAGVGSRADHRLLRSRYGGARHTVAAQVKKAVVEESPYLGSTVQLVISMDWDGLKGQSSGDSSNVLDSLNAKTAEAPEDDAC